MKVPKSYQKCYLIELLNYCQTNAIKMTAEYGIPIDIKVIYKGNSYELADVEEIIFKIGQNEFESLKDLRKALRNKAFL